MSARRKRPTLESLSLEEGMPVVVHLVAPKEQVWGVLVSLSASGIVTRGIDMRAFDEWVRQAARADQETMLGLSTLFYPMHRIERVEKDETIGPVEGHAARLEREVGEALHKIVVRDALAS
jgi:hypothetical protein